MRDLLGRMKSSFWVFIIRRSGFLTALLEGYEKYRVGPGDTTQLPSGTPFWLFADEIAGSIDVDHVAQVRVHYLSTITPETRHDWLGRAGTVGEQRPW